jgi:DNA polymerase III epsilon subunit-like protein
MWRPTADRPRGATGSLRWESFASRGAALPRSITPAMCVGQPTFAQQMPGMMPLLAGAIVVGHNVRFDLSFLSREMGRARMPIEETLGNSPVLDTLRLARRRFGRGGNSLGLLSRRLGIEPVSAHRALADAKTTHLVMQELLSPLGGWELTLADVFLHQGGPMHLGGKKPGTQLSQARRVTVDCEAAAAVAEAQSEVE